MKNIKIEVSSRLFSPGHFHAQIEGRPDIWADGTTMDDTIGNLIRFHPEVFKVKIEFIGTTSR